MPSAALAVVLISAQLLQGAAAAGLIQRLVRNNAALTRLTRLDPLTGLANRRGLHHAHHALDAAGTPAGILLLDLIGFKQLNDRYGHDSGDQLLRHVATRLTHLAAVRGGTAGRLGGDEFVLLLPDHTSEQLIATAEQTIAALAVPIELPSSGAVHISAVIGVAEAADAPSGQPYRAADIALYQARHHHQLWALYTAGMTHPAPNTPHGPRTREYRPQRPATVVDHDRLQQITTLDGESDAFQDLRSTIAILDPRSRAFGTDVADLVHDCLDLGLLRHHLPVTGITIQPTTTGEYRDGGFLVLAEITDTLTLASPPIGPEQFADTGGQTTIRVLDAVAATIDQLHAAFTSR